MIIEGKQTAEPPRQRSPFVSRSMAALKASDSAISAGIGRAVTIEAIFLLRTPWRRENTTVSKAATMGEFCNNRGVGIRWRM